MTRKLVITGLVTAAATTTAAFAHGAAPAPSAAASVPVAKSSQLRTFVAPRGAWVRGVDLVLDAPSKPGTSIEIRAVQGGHLTRAVLAAVSVPLAAAGRREIALPTPSPVLAGGRYAIVVSAPLGGSRSWFTAPEYGYGPVAPARACTAS
jgi:hypothetical protein